MFAVCIFTASAGAIVGGETLEDRESASTAPDTGLRLSSAAPAQNPTQEAEAALDQSELQVEAAETSTAEPEPTAEATAVPTAEPTPEPTPEREPFPERDDSKLYVEYEVQPGDTLGAIADHYGLSVDDLFWSNPGLADVDLIGQGITLRIPSTDGIVHESVGGETVYDIALKYGVTVESLTWFSANETPEPFQKIENGREVLVLHANPPITDDAPPPGETGEEAEDGVTDPEAGGAATPPDATEETPDGENPPTAEGTPPAGPDIEPPETSCVPTVENAPCFIWPVDGPVTSGFGPRGDVGFHDGIDIDVPNDGNHTPIEAAAAGDVAWAGCGDNGYGCYVILDHGFGWTTRYDHFTSIDVAEGQHVEQGQVLGLSGCTGYCRGEHLHFAILFEGKAVNPVGYLPPR